MNTKRNQSNEPIDEIEVVDDFLPSPDELAFTEDTIKVTIQLSRSSIEFFKAQAKTHGTPYQKMIRRLLDAYVEHHRGG